MLHKITYQPRDGQGLETPMPLQAKQGNRDFIMRPVGESMEILESGSLSHPWRGNRVP